MQIFCLYCLSRPKYYNTQILRTVYRNIHAECYSVVVRGH